MLFLVLGCFSVSRVGEKDVKAIAPTDFGALRAPLAIAPKSVGALSADLAIAPKWAGAPMTGSVGGGGDFEIEKSV